MVGAVVAKEGRIIGQGLSLIHIFAVFVLPVWRMVQFLLEIHQKKKPETSRYSKKLQALFRLNWKFTAQAASSWGQVKEGSQMALFPFTSLSMRFPFSCSRTSPYATCLLYTSVILLIAVNKIVAKMNDGKGL